jgi:hypothetical protein
MKTSKFGKKNTWWQCEVEKNLKHHGWVMGHGWGSHGGTWKMGAWGWNIAPETLHVLAGICFGGLGCLGIETHVQPLTKTWHVSRVVIFEVHVSRCMVSDQPKPSSSHHQNTTCFHVGLFQGLHCPCMETHVRPPWSEWHIYDSLLK